MIENDTYYRRHARELGIDPELINPASVDLRLGGHIIEYRREWWILLLDKVRITARGNLVTTDPKQHGKPCPTYDNRDRIYEYPGRRDIRLRDGESFTFQPGRFYLAHSVEDVHIPRTHAAALYLKSSPGRLGFNHSHSGWGDPAWYGQWTFEFVCYLPITFTVGQRIVQMVLKRMTGEPEHDYQVTGRYNGQTGATEAR